MKLNHVHCRTIHFGQKRPFLAQTTQGDLVSCGIQAACEFYRLSLSPTEVKRIHQKKNAPFRLTLNHAHGYFLFGITPVTFQLTHSRV